jgi:hypothetical protein
MGKQISKTANNEALSINGDLQQLALRLHSYFCDKTRFGLIENPIYFTDFYKLVKRKLDEDPKFREQFGRQIRFTDCYSGELEYMLGYLEDIGKIEMHEGNIRFPVSNTHN